MTHPLTTRHRPKRLRAVPPLTPTVAHELGTFRLAAFVLDSLRQSPLVNKALWKRCAKQPKPEPIRYATPCLDLSDGRGAKVAA